MMVASMATRAVDSMTPMRTGPRSDRKPTPEDVPGCSTLTVPRLGRAAARPRRAGRPGARDDRRRTRRRRRWSRSSALTAPVPAGRDADPLLELTGQVRLVGETAARRDLGDGGAGALQQHARAFDALLEDERVRRGAGRRPELASEVEPAQPGDGGEVVQGDGLGEVLVDVVADRAVLLEG